MTSVGLHANLLNLDALREYQLTLDTRANMLYLFQTIKLQDDITLLNFLNMFQKTFFNPNEKREFIKHVLHISWINYKFHGNQ